MPSRSQYGPAAGASGGRKPYAAGIHVPDFLRLEGKGPGAELDALLRVMRNPLATQVYLLILTQTDFADGEFLSTYARLIELCTEPQPERGPRLAAPTMKQMRRAVDLLEAQRLVWRDSGSNKAQGQLRLRVLPRKKKARPGE